jgi:hypothetical protein
LALLLLLSPQVAFVLAIFHLLLVFNALYHWLIKTLMLEVLELATEVTFIQPIPLPQRVQ